LSGTHQLVVADNSHNAQWLHAILLRIEVRVSKHHIRMLVRIQILNPVLTHLILERGLALSCLIGPTVTPFVVQSVAVNVHVVVLAAVGCAVQVNGIGDVAAVGESVLASNSISEASCEFVVAFSRLGC
jgi:hypothetical protein